jgi:hypothetical protein
MNRNDPSRIFIVMKITVTIRQANLLGTLPKDYKTNPSVGKADKIKTTLKGK